MGQLETVRDHKQTVGLDNYWGNQEDGMSGNAIDFFVKLCGKNFNETMKLLQL